MSGRDAFGAAAAALALGVTAQSEAAVASAVEVQREPWSPDAIRERIALVVETFTRVTVAYPDPMTQRKPPRRWQ